MQKELVAETTHSKKVYLAQPHTFWMLFLQTQMEM